MRNRLFVLDQNKLREKAAPEVAAYLKNSPDVQFVLPEVAFIEMTKNPAFREETLRGSLQMLSEYPSRVHVAKSFQQCYEEETTRLVPSSNHMTLRDHRNSVRSLLEEVRADPSDLHGLERIIHDPDNIHGLLSRYYLDNDANKERLAESIDVVRKIVGESFVKDLRANRVPRDVRLQIIRQQGWRQLANMLKRLHICDAKARAFVKKKPILLRECYSVLWLALDWIGSGGFEDVKPEKITNDLIDQEYVITATCFDGIISGERRVINAFNDIKSVLGQAVFLV